MRVYNHILLPLLLLFVVSSNSHAATPQSESSKVKNVIYMIGDGMGVGHVTAAMIRGGYAPINMERAQAVGLVKTYSANNRVTDSAAAGTALAAGTKVENSRVGINPQGNVLKSVMMKAKEDGNRTGIVVTCHVAHATPATFYANVHNRSEYDSIMVQLLGSDIDVIIGGGKKYLTEREDKRNLEREFIGKEYKVVYDFEQVENISGGKLLALLAPKDMKYCLDGRGDYLPKATDKAMQILSSNATKERGFFLMVEGSLIDYASHGNNTEKLIAEMIDFDNAVGVAFDYADVNPGTLVVVLADHETGGLSIPSAKEDFTEAESGIYYNYGSKSHTGTMVPLFAYGTGAENFSRVFDNTDIPKLIEKLMMAK